MPAPPRSRLPSVSRSTTSSSDSGSSAGADSASTRPNGGHARAPRRRPSSTCVSTWSPRRLSTASGASQSVAASTTRLASAVLRTASTPANASSPRASTRRISWAPRGSRSASSASQAAPSGPSSAGSRAANAGSPAPTGAAGLRTSRSAVASHSARTSESGECSRMRFSPVNGSAYASGGNAPHEPAQQLLVRGVQRPDPPRADPARRDGRTQPPPRDEVHPGVDGRRPRRHGRARFVPHGQQPRQRALERDELGVDLRPRELPASGQHELDRGPAYHVAAPQRQHAFPRRIRGKVGGLGLCAELHARNAR